MYYSQCMNCRGLLILLNPDPDDPHAGWSHMNTSLNDDHYPIEIPYRWNTLEHARRAIAPRQSRAADS